MCLICGVIGHEPNPELLTIIEIIMEEQQHRGHDGHGIAYSNGLKIHEIKSLGLAANFFENKKNQEEIKRHKPIIIGAQTRYGTTGNVEDKNTLRDMPPATIKIEEQLIILTLNGNIPNVEQKKESLIKKGTIFDTKTDTEYMLKQIYEYSGRSVINIANGIKEFITKVSGGYSAALILHDKVFLIRDPYGNHPLFYGELEGNIVYASENCTLKDKLSVMNIKSVKPGTMLEIEIGGNITEHEVKTDCPRCHCVFEMIYFSRPDSIIFGSKEQNESFRYRLGKELAEIHPVNEKADFIFGVPESGIPAAEGVADGSHLNFRRLLIASKFIPRTFTSNGTLLRLTRAQRKYTPLYCVLQKYRRPGGGDDSLVRGLTTKELILMIKIVARRDIPVSFFISSPPIKYPCYYGMDFPSRDELIAAHRSINQICEEINANYLGYLHLENLKQVLEERGNNPDHFCFACFNGEYKIPLN